MKWRSDVLQESMIMLVFYQELYTNLKILQVRSMF